MIQIQDLYSQEVKDIYFNKVKEQFLKKTKSLDAGSIADLFIEIIDIIGEDSYDEYFYGKTDDENFKYLVLMPPKDLYSLARVIQERIDVSKEGTNIQRLKKVYTECSLMGKQQNKRKLNTILIDSLNLNICPYCNRNYINTRVDIENPSKSSFGAQMDHFYSKDKYPIFSVCLYNFIPVCGVCNLIKGTTDFKVFPFLEDEEKKHEVRFNYRYSNLDEIELYFETSDEREADMNTIKLGEAYAIHHLDVKNMLIREEQYSKSYREELRDLFRSHGEVGNNVFQLSLADDEIDRMIFGDSVFEEDIKNISLGKFKKDIYQEIKSLRDY